MLCDTLMKCGFEISKLNLPFLTRIIRCFCQYKTPGRYFNIADLRYKLCGEVIQNIRKNKTLECALLVMLAYCVERIVTWAVQRKKNDFKCSEDLRNWTIDLSGNRMRREFIVKCCHCHIVQKSLSSLLIVVMVARFSFLFCGISAGIDWCTTAVWTHACGFHVSLLQKKETKYEIRIGSNRCVDTTTQNEMKETKNNQQIVNC